MPNVLILHGNGGSRTRFIPLLRSLILHHPEIHPVIPKLSGFDGRKLIVKTNYWDLFLEEIREAVGDRINEEWVLYGHGIGGSILLELAGRDFRFPGGEQLRVTQTILHAPIGATLQYRRFPSLMKPRLVRTLGKWLLTRKLLRPLWVKRLFQRPEAIPPYLLEQFFQDYTRCRAFGVFFDMITPDWYQELRNKLTDKRFYFLWGADERVIQVKHLAHWQNDFFHSEFDIVPDWDHFPMLEDSEAFTEKFVEMVSQKTEERPQSGEKRDFPGRSR
jgi:pimeloyl-ACP methyl ester carboxylesterase